MKARAVGPVTALLLGVAAAVVVYAAVQAVRVWLFSTVTTHGVREIVVLRAGARLG